MAAQDDNKNNTNPPTQSGSLEVPGSSQEMPAPPPPAAIPPQQAPLNNPQPPANFTTPPPSPPPPAAAVQSGTPQPPESGEKPASKKSFPKTIIIILIAILVLSGLGYAAYTFGGKLLGGNKQETGGDIVWWGLWEDESLVAPLIEEYENSHPGITINYVRQDKTDYRERLHSALAKGDGPDIFRIHNTWVPMFKKDLDTIPSSVMSPAAYAETFYPVVVSDMSVGSSFAGIPLGIDTLNLYVNEDIFESFGRPIPQNWNDFRETAIGLTVTDNQGRILQSGAAIGRTENVDHWQEILGLMMSQNGVRLSNPTGRRAEAALEYFTVFSTTDGVWDETLPPSTVSFANGKLAMYFAPSWRAFEIKQLNPDLRFKVVPVPQLPKDDPSQSDVAYASYWVESVWSKSKKKDAAWEFLKFMSQQDSLQKFYQNASATRLFGEPYPRPDMADLLSDDPYVGAVVAQAPGAKSWYLASRTFDGSTGINTQLSKYFEDAVNGVIQGTASEKVLSSTAQAVQQVLTNYGIAASQ